MIIDEKVAEQAETREEVERRVRQELVEKGREFGGVKFGFVEPKLKVQPEKLPQGLNWNLFSNNLTDEEKTRLSFMFNKVVDYLSAPIITDDFICHDDRGKWELEHLSKLSPQAWTFYKNNRLGLTNNSRPKGLVDYLSKAQEDYKAQEDVFIDSRILSRLEGLISIMPEEIKNGNLYSRIELDKENEMARKLKIVDKMGPIFSAVIWVLGEPTTKQKS